MSQSGISRFFAFARERHAIHLRRRAGQPWPWTSDPILQRYRFTNVFRELDATTVWFRENVRDPLRASPDVLLATVLFRWFNRITTGEAIFSQTCSLSEHGAGTPWELWQRHRWEDTEDFMDVLTDAILSYCRTPTGRGYRQGPYVTGAYIIKTPDGHDKLEGVLQCVQWFMEEEFTAEYGTIGPDLRPFGWEWLSELLLSGPEMVTLQEVWSWLRRFPYMGDFMAYEVVTDLRHTDLLCRAPDIMTWANPGPGAARGAGRVLHESKDHYQPSQKSELVSEMQELLRLSQMEIFWPQWTEDSVSGESTYDWHCDLETPHQEEGDWPAWEMRDVEHTLCEFDKYERARLGEGRPRGVYRHD